MALQREIDMPVLRWLSVLSLRLASEAISPRWLSNSATVSWPRQD
ncbi:hypothetical protein yinte0001_22890 [Yersinia intermedia ATCC 29909]|nr:hypothetical protein yinte0001_22890 [Yersinia intermedia ATCC 29909]